MQYLTVLCFLAYGIHVLCVQNLSHKTANDIIDYYQNYDYELSNNVTVEEIKPDTLILPNPENLASKYTIDVLPDVQLPSDSLADTDLKDHDFIDNLMYIYYGSHVKNETSVGSEIIIVGSVLSCAAQLLTIFCALLRRNQNGKREVNKVFLNMISCLCLANLVFMLGVYATKNAVRCHVIAVLLHYLHLLTAFWIFLHCYYIYKKFSSDFIPKLRYICLLAYGVPFILVMLSFVVSSNSYETKYFCFVSVQRGMLLNYMLPVSVLIVATTILALNGIRKINLELSKLELTSSESLNALRTEDVESNDRKIDIFPDEEVVSLREFKGCLKTLSLVQTSYDVVWFIAVLALENGIFSNVMPVMYAIASCSLNWYIFWKLKIFLPSTYGSIEKPCREDKASHKEITDKSLQKNLHANSTCSSSDNIPLLNSTDCYTELIELRHDTISTISS